MRASPLIPVLVGVVAVARVATAQPCDDASALRAELQKEATRADHWNLGWRIVYTAGAVSQLAAAASGRADHDTTTGLWVGGASSTVAALGHWIVPLVIQVPAATGDPCADRAALRATAERAARDERRAFLASHVANLALNVAGGLIVAEQTSWTRGLTSFAFGYGVGLLDTYTMPTASWHRVRESTWTATVAAWGSQYTLGVTGSF